MNSGKGATSGLKKGQGETQSPRPKNDAVLLLSEHTEHMDHAQHQRLRNSSENLAFTDNKCPSMEENFAHYCKCTLRHYSKEADARNLHDDVTFGDSPNGQLVTGACFLCGGRVVKEHIPAHKLTPTKKD